MEIGFWILIIFILIYEPIIGYFDFKKFQKDVTLNKEAREKYYINTMVGLWVPTIFILILVFFTDLSLEDIGLSLPEINPVPIGPVITYIGLGVALLYFLVLLYYTVAYYTSEKFRSKFSKVREKELNNIGYYEILPVTQREKKTWNYVSMTAGITEEIIYRGFLIYALAYLFPAVSIWVILLISSLLFGLAHTYQGLGNGVLRTAIVGLLFAIVYIGLGSLLPLIALHFLLDYVAKLGDTEAPES